MPKLSDDDRAVLEFEDTHTGHRPMKEEQIRAAFGISPTRYYQRLTAIIKKPSALAAMPSLVYRLRKIEAARVATRAERRLAPSAR